MKNLVVDVFNKKNQYKGNDQNQVKFDDPGRGAIIYLTLLRISFVVFMAIYSHAASCLSGRP